MKNAPVAILGNTNIDLIMGPLPRLPSFGRELIVPVMEARASGAAGYTAMALDRLGVPCVPVGAVGSDHWAEFIRRAFVAYPLMDLSHLESVPGVGTGLSVALLNEQGERGFVTYAGALDRADAALVKRHEQALLASRFVLVCGYFFMPELRGEPLRLLLRRLRKAGVVTMLDTGWDLEDWPPANQTEVLSLLPDVDLFLPNVDEAVALVGEGAPDECAQRLLRHGARSVVLKLGPDGSLFSDGKQIVRQPGRAVKALDTTGAGDSHNAALIYGMLQGWSMERTLAFANVFCSIIVSRLAERIPGVQETLAQLKNGVRGQ